MKDFSSIPKERIELESEHFVVFADAFPVSLGHRLIVSKRVVPTFFDLSELERAELPDVIEQTRTLIERDSKPDGFNIGMNCGAAAGQTVKHFHCHVIPRFIGDISDPRGGKTLYSGKRQLPFRARLSELQER